MKDFQEWFRWGMDRELPPLMQVHDPYLMQSLVVGRKDSEVYNKLNLGAGKKLVPGTVPLNSPGWMGGDPLPFDDGSVDEIFSFHFFEHLNEVELLLTLRECQRVLVVGGVMWVTVPYYSAAIAHQDIDHKLFFTEETWKNIFDNPYYDKVPGFQWKLFTSFNLIAGIVERNLSLFTQIVRGE